MALRPNRFFFFFHVFFEVKKKHSFLHFFFHAKIKESVNDMQVFKLRCILSFSLTISKALLLGYFAETAKSVLSLNLHIFSISPQKETT